MLSGKQETPMSNSKDSKSLRSLLKDILATTFFVCLLEMAFLGAGICQTPGYGEKPDQWAPYESGKYFDRLQEILGIYNISGSKIAYLHYELNDVRVGPVELFRIPMSRSLDCGEKVCYFFILIASDHSDSPLLTPCQFKLAALTHLFNPDGSRFFDFEFSCADTVLQVKVTPTHFMAIPVKKTP
jgi:hypothetical protein